MKHINPVVVLSAIGAALGVAGAYAVMYEENKLLAVSLLIPSIIFLARARVLIQENRYRKLLDLLEKEFPKTVKEGT